MGVGRGRCNELETCFHSFAKICDVATFRRSDDIPQFGVIGDHYWE
jgi:hypothetical protein